MIVIALIAGFAAQLILFNFFPNDGAGVNINILLILTVEIALIRGSYRGEIFGFFSGLLEDIFVFGLIGERAIIRALAGFLIGKFSRRFSVENVVFQFFLVFFVFIIHSGFIYVVRLIFSYPPPALNKVLLNSAINGFLAPGIYHIIRKTIARQ
ncbi:rod shape-determining protein MreD [Elusimicrobiota bacterium]